MPKEKHYIFRTDSDFVYCSKNKNAKVDGHGDSHLIGEKTCSCKYDECLDCLEKHLVA